MSFRAVLQKGLATAVLIGLLAIVVFKGILTNGAVSWDDARNFQIKMAQLPAFADTLTWAWRVKWATVFQPLSWHLFWVEATLGGGQATAVYHWVSLLLHAANAGLFFLLLLRFYPLSALENTSVRLLGCAIAILFFVVHPLRVEAVAWAPGQSLLWSTLFCLFSTHAFWVADSLPEGARSPSTGLSLFFMVAACLCDAQAAILPFLLVVLCAYRRRLSPDGKGLSLPIGFWIVSLATVVLGFAARSGTLGGGDHSIPAFVLKPALFLSGFFVRTLVPWPLSPLYSTPGTWGNLLAFVVCAAALGLCWRLLRLFPWLRYGLVAEAIVLIPPILGLFAEGVPFADHYSYLPALILSVPVAGGVIRLLENDRYRSGALAAVYVVMAFLAVLTLRRVPVWDSSETLWRDAMARSVSRGSLARVYLAASMGDRQKYWEAGDLLRETLKRGEDLPQVYNALGVNALLQEKTEDARKYFVESVTLEPLYAEGQGNLGATLLSLGRAEEALGHVDASLRLFPANTNAHQNRARILEKLNRAQEAVDEWKIVAAIDSANVEAHTHLGIAFAGRGDVVAAADQFRKAVVLSPKVPSSHFNLALMLLQMGMTSEAKRALAETLEVDSTFKPAREMLSKLR